VGKTHNAAYKENRTIMHNWRL